MAGPSDVSVLDIDLDHVLWRTRGLNWDYLFLLRPSAPAADSWHEIHSQVFGALTPETFEQHRAGTLSVGLEEASFIAAAFIDPSRRDVAGRPVSHYLIWFRPAEAAARELVSVPADWGRQLVTALGPALDTAFGLPLPDPARPAGGPSTDDVEAVVSDALSRLPRPVRVQGPAAQVPVRLTLTFQKKKPRHPSSGLSGRRAVLILAAAVLLVIALWLLLGPPWTRQGS